jgi:DNA-directed RNA polymerase subunit RPC12/RpoP
METSIRCPKCGSDNTTAKTGHITPVVCYTCGNQFGPGAKKKISTPVKVIAAVGFVLVWVFVLSDVFTKTNKGIVVPGSMQSIQNKVAADAVEQYEIAVRQGDKIQIAVQAGFVCAAYLQAKDEPNYRKWKEIERQAKINAGLP